MNFTHLHQTSKVRYPSPQQMRVSINHELEPKWLPSVVCCCVLLCVVVLLCCCCCCCCVVVVLCCCCVVDSKRIIVVRWADLSDFFVDFRRKSVCVVSRPMKIVTFLRKNDYLPKRVVDFPLERDTFRNKIMEIVEDFDEKSYNNNGKPWKSSRILRVKQISSFFFLVSSFFYIFSFFFSFFHFFHFFHFFIFLIFLIFHLFHFFIFSFFHFFFIVSFFSIFIFHRRIVKRNRNEIEAQKKSDF